MRKTMFGWVLAVGLGVGLLAMAQDQTPAPVPQDNGATQNQRSHVVDPAVQAQHMAKRLNLTQDQQSQVAAILTAQRDQVTSLRSDNSLSKQDRHARMMAIRTDSEAKIKSLLNDDQKQAFDQMQQRRLEKQQIHKS